MVTIRRTRFTVFKIITAVIICALSAYVLNSYFTIRTIEVQGEKVLVQVDEDKLPGSLLFFPTDRVAEELKSQNPVIESVSFKKKFPHTLVLLIKKHEPTAILKTPNQMLYVSRNGVVTGDAQENSKLPLLNFDHPIVRPGTFVADEQIKFSLLLAAYSNDAMPFQQIDKYDNESVRIVSGETEILISQKKQLSDSISTLQNLISGVRIKGIVPKRIDLRFDKAIIQ